MTVPNPDADAGWQKADTYSRDCIAQLLACQASSSAALASDGEYSARVVELLRQKCGMQRVLLTPSCTAALEMAVILANVQPGDEVLLPSFTFVSTANAVCRAGGKPIFADIRSDTWNIDESKLERHIGAATKAVIPVHYAGVACEMTQICRIAREADLVVIEDAAQAINARYKGQPLGSIGDLSCYSFHFTKNISCGEGGALCINNSDFERRADVIRNKGTNRADFRAGLSDKYTWVDIGSSFIPSELATAFLFGQLTFLDDITSHRRALVARYREMLQPLADNGWLRLQHVPKHATPNGHLLAVMLPHAAWRNEAIARLMEKNVSTSFHFVPLHTSPFGKKLGYRAGDLPTTEDVASRLLRLPLSNQMELDDVERVAVELTRFLAHRPNSSAVSRRAA